MEVICNIYTHVLEPNCMVSIRPWWSYHLRYSYFYTGSIALIQLCIRDESDWSHPSCCKFALCRQLFISVLLVKIHQDRRIIVGKRVSATAEHAVGQNYVLGWEQAKQIDKEADRTTRWLKKLIWIRSRGDDTMNKDEGAYKDFLPAHQKTAIQFEQGWRHQQALKQLVDQILLPVLVNRISSEYYFTWDLYQKLSFQPVYYFKLKRH